MKKSLFIASLLFIGQLNAQLGPVVTSWILNPTNATGYGGIVTNVQQVQYSTNNVYVSASCIPGYSIGPWTANPNTPVNQNFVYKFTRNPQQNTGSPTAVGMGHTGVWTNGVSIFNVSDGMSYNNAGVWNRNAYFWEGISFDDCLGHPAPNGEYHHHVSPRCLYNITDSTHHSPIIGFAFDGYPVYGAWAYANTNGTGGLKRMRSSYTTTTTSTRTNGPSVSSTYPVGCFMEDYVFTSNAGDLDFRNGRFCVTPEYPAGTYAYFVTLDGNLDPQFPYTMYKSYYGIVQAGNTGPNGGHNTVTESVTSYTGTTGVIESAEEVIEYKVYPNPANDQLNIIIAGEASDNVSITIQDLTGKTIMVVSQLEINKVNKLNVSELGKGVNLMRIRTGAGDRTEKLIIQ
jgi:hypothetical protein